MSVTPFAAAPSPAGAADTPTEKLSRLRHYLRDLGSALVCYSGGIDSALVLAVAHEELSDQALGITAVSPSLADREKLEAGRFAASIGARHQYVETNELSRPKYAANGPDRCFHCKSELYEVAAEFAKRTGFTHILNGTNRDDHGDFRPGLEAAKRAGIKSPLAELGFRKSDVRDVARLLELSIWDKPASACLSSRIPYGTSVTPERLKQIGGFEQDLKDLGFRQVRVRWHDKIARLEMDLEQLQQATDPSRREAIVAAGKQHGFQYVTLDLAGYRVGSHNEVLSGRSLPIIN